MQIKTSGNYLHIIPEAGDQLNLNYLLGWRRKKGDPKIVAEDNVVNRIVLGQPALRNLTSTYIWDDNDVDYEFDRGLKNYQILDVKKMCGLTACLNANPMGLGKTIETVRWLDDVLWRTTTNPIVLIVCPKIVRQQWVDQIKKWWGKDATIYEGQRTVGHGIWIVNYDKLRNERTLMRFKSFLWDALVLDEAHKIKSRTAKQTIAVNGIPAARKVALTGTPILRYVDDLWSILHFLDWRYSGISYWNFVNYFCHVQQTPWGNKITGLSEDPAKVAMLNKLLSLVAVRNNAVEVAHGKTTEVVRVPMSKAQRELYKQEKQLLLDDLPENCTISNGAVLTTRLRQTTSWPGLFLGAKEPGPKFEWILETFMNNPDESFVVFSAFEQTVSALTQYLNDNGVACVKITGQQDARTNLASKDLFTDKTARVLAGTIGAMGQGFDGLQQVSRLMIFIDRDWSPEIMAQAEDRLHRMGQESPVNIYYLECQGSFDQHVGRINKNKADDIREALNNDE